MLSTEEIIRYDRHLLLPGFGKEKQEKLKQAKVLIVGAGGLGSAAALYLTAAGIGNLGIIDNDTVDLSNLQRQILYDHKDIGRKKSTMSAIHLREKNPFISIIPYEENLVSENAKDIISKYDIVVSTLDNSATRYLINDICISLHKVFVHASVSGFEGQLSVCNYKGGPSYRDIFPEPPSTDFPDKADKGILATVPGILGCMQATEVLKILTNTDNVLSGKLLIINMLNYSLRIINI